MLVRFQPSALFWLKMMRKLFYCLVFFLIIVQVLTSPRQSLLYQSEIDLIEQRQRMMDYPSSLYHLAHLLEERPESRLFFRLQKNFFLIFDFNSSPIFYLLPIIVIGCFSLIKKKDYFPVFISLIIPVIFLTFLGPNLSYGYFCLYPFLFISLVNGIKTIFNKK